MVRYGCFNYPVAVDADCLQDNKLPKEVKKKLRFLHTLKMGLPEVGLGCLTAQGDGRRK